MKMEDYKAKVNVYITRKLKERGLTLEQALVEYDRLYEENLKRCPWIGRDDVAKEDAKEIMRAIWNIV